MYSLYSCLHFTLNSASGARFFLPSFLPQRDSREHLVPRQQRLASILKEAEAATVAKGRKEEEEEEEALVVTSSSHHQQKQMRRKSENGGVPTPTLPQSSTSNAHGSRVLFLLESGEALERRSDEDGATEPTAAASAKTKKQRRKELERRRKSLEGKRDIFMFIVCGLYFFLF